LFGVLGDVASSLPFLPDDDVVRHALALIYQSCVHTCVQIIHALQGPSSSASHTIVKILSNVLFALHRTLQEPPRRPWLLSSPAFGNSPHDDIRYVVTWLMGNCLKPQRSVTSGKVKSEVFGRHVVGYLRSNAVVFIALVVSCSRQLEWVKSLSLELDLCPGLPGWARLEEAVGSLEDPQERHDAMMALRLVLFP